MELSLSVQLGGSIQSNKVKYKGKTVLLYNNKKK